MPSQIQFASFDEKVSLYHRHIKNTRDAFIRNKLLQTRISISECSIIHRNAFDSYPSANKKL